MPGHWCFLLYDYRSAQSEASIRWCDPLFPPCVSVPWATRCERLWAFAQRFFERARLSLPEIGIHQYDLPDPYRQTDGTSCGLVLVSEGAHLAKGEPREMSFSNADACARGMRRRLAKLLYSV